MRSENVDADPPEKNQLKLVVANIDLYWPWTATELAITLMILRYSEFIFYVR